MTTGFFVTGFLGAGFLGVGVLTTGTVTGTVVVVTVGGATTGGVGVGATTGVVVVVTGTVVVVTVGGAETGAGVGAGFVGMGAPQGALVGHVDVSEAPATEANTVKPDSTKTILASNARIRVFMETPFLFVCREKPLANAKDYTELRVNVSFKTVVGRTGLYKVYFLVFPCPTCCHLNRHLGHLT